MRQAIVLYKKEKAGELIQDDDGKFSFCYSDNWFCNSDKPAISLTLPKTKQEYTANYLFSFFYNMLPEGSNKQVVCLLNRIDEKDAFGLLLNTAFDDTIGAVTVQREEKSKDEEK